MTGQQKQEKAPAAQLTAATGSRLDELLSMYDNAKAQAAEAKDRLEAVTSALKAEASAAVPEGTTDVALSGSTPGLPRLRMTWKQPWRFDVKRFRAERPADYVRYEVRSDGHWEIRAE